MLDVKTPLSKIHRLARKVDPSAVTAEPGSWISIQTGSAVNLVGATNATQQPILKMVLGNASSNQYESNDIEVGRLATIEGVFRATVDTDGYQKYVGGTGTQTLSTAVTYTEGADLSVAYKTTSATATSAAGISPAGDIGKLMPATTGNIVVGRVETHDSTNSTLTFETVTPHIKA